MPTVTLNNGKIFQSEQSVSILDEARRAGVVLEHSCRTGRCGVCKARVLSGDTVLLRPESESLGLDECEQGMILTCCRAAASDVVVDIEPLDRLADLEIRTMPARIVSLDRLATDVMRVILRTPPSSPMKFLPGQYIDVIANGVRRSYSLANAPRSDERLELLIKRLPGGALSEYWFDRAKVNDLVRLEGPLGTFFFRENPPKNVAFLATGTGIAPVKAMLEELSTVPSMLEGVRVRVFWGNRFAESFCLDPNEICSGVDVHRLISGKDEDWNGERGYVHTAAIEDGINPDSTVVYACGSNAMIVSARNLFKNYGLPTNRFFSDAFLGSH